MIRIGDPAPAFRGRSTQGEEVSLDAFRGRHLVLYFFPKAFTPGCTTQAKRFRDNYGELKALGADVVGVSVDDHATQCEFARSLEARFPMVADPDRTISKQYGVVWKMLPLNKRVTFVIDPEGRVAARFQHEIQVSRHLDNVLHFLRGAVRPSSADL